MTRPERWFRVYGEGPTPRCTSPLLEAWRRACLEEERAAATGHPIRRTLAAVARVACEEAMLDARRN